jgi:hypothetical protein
MFLFYSVLFGCGGHTPGSVCGQDISSNKGNTHGVLLCVKNRLPAITNPEEEQHAIVDYYLYWLQFGFAWKW